MRNSYSNPTLVLCRFTGNVAYNGGGGVHNKDSTPVLKACTLVDNWADDRGGAFHSFRGGVVLSSCVILNNSAVTGGGGIYVMGGDYVLVNCTVAENEARGSMGGGVFVGGGGRVTVTNCVMRANLAPLGAQIAIKGNDIAELTVSHSNIEGESSGVYVYAKNWYTVNWAEGVFDSVDGFALVGDYHPVAGAPVVDAAVNVPAEHASDVDADGNPRGVDGDGDGSAAADLGAYEYHPEASTLAISPSLVEVFLPRDGPEPEDQFLTLRSVGNRTLTWHVETTCDWLQTDPPAGESMREPIQARLIVDASGLALGTHTCQIVVTADDAINTPRVIPVNLHVNRTYRVPSQYPTIQAAVDATSARGDIVLVADGTYTLSLHKIDVHVDG